MVWFFDRDNESLSWEIRRNTDAYEITVRHPDGTSIVHAVETPIELLEKVETMPLAFIKAGWRPRNEDLLALLTR